MNWFWWAVYKHSSWTGLMNHWWMFMNVHEHSLTFITWWTSPHRGGTVKFWRFLRWRGGGPRVVVSTAVLHARVRGSVPGLGGFKETKNVSPPSTCESQYCEEPPWPRGSMLGLRPPGLKFRILCLEDSVISIISPSSGGSPGPV